MNKSDKFKLATSDEAPTTIQDWLNSSSLTFDGQLTLLSELGKMTEDAIKLKSEAMSKELTTIYESLTETEKQEYVTSLQSFVNALKKNESIENIKIPNETFAKLVVAVIHSTPSQSIYGLYVRNMILVYAIAKFEDLIGTYLDIVFSFRPEVLRSTKTLTYEQILEHTTLDQLKGEMIRKEINAVMRENIEDLNDYLNTKLRLDLRNRPEWPRLIECLYRRHCIIHNKGKPDIQYSKKVKPTHPIRTLDVDENYLVEVLSMLRNIAKYMKEFIVSKYIK